jgi:ubiquinone biosynthesis accessory factor UbiK
MLDAKHIEKVAQQVVNSLPKPLKSMADSVEEQVKLALKSQLVKLDVVTREEFDVQKNVLLKTREQLELLKEQVKELTK